MKDEIKEIILDDLKLKDIRYHKCKEKDLSFNTEDYQAHLLLDYITNLQEENERLKELDENYPIEEQLAEALKYENIYKLRIDKAIHRIQLLQMDNEVTVKDLGLIARDLTGGDE